MPEKNQGRSFFFQASSFQLLKLENLLRCSFFTFSYNRSSSMNYFIYTSHHTSNTSLNWLPVRSHNTSETKLKTESIIFKILSSISNQSKKLVQHIDITVRYTITKSLQRNTLVQFIPFLCHATLGTKHPFPKSVALGER